MELYTCKKGKHKRKSKKEILIAVYKGIKRSEGKKY